MFVQILRLIRPWQWIKNGVVLAGLIFSGTAFVREYQIKALLAFFAFCLVSSAVYSLNDIIDRERDRRHPMKQNRPLASGKLSVTAASVVAVVFAAAGLGLSLTINRDLLIVATCYLLLNIFYTFYLKEIVIIDVMSIAAGFVLRALAGAVAIGVVFSNWLLISTFVLALFLALGKRRAEIVSLEQRGATHRKILERYSSYLLDQLIGVVTASTVITYFFYTLI